MKDLMQKRWLVIASFPDNDDYPVGDILDRDWCRYVNSEDESEGVVWRISEYPHLFRELQWWEYRDKSEMPKYVKHRDKIYKVTGWLGENCPYIEGEKHPFAPEVFIPATEKDFNEYINSKKL